MPAPGVESGSARSARGFTGQRGRFADQAELDVSTAGTQHPLVDGHDRSGAEKHCDDGDADEATDHQGHSRVELHEHERHHRRDDCRGDQKPE